MADRSSIAEIVNIGIESTPGTAVAANRRLQAVKFNLNPDGNTDSFKPSGSKFPTLVYQTREFTTGSIEGKLTYNELAYLLSMGLTSATPTQVMDGATPTGAYTWVFNPVSFGPDSPKTATIEKGQAFRAHRVPFALLSGLSFGVTRNETTVGGDVLARRLEDGVTLTPNPTEVEAVPVLPGHVDVFMDSTFAGIGTTKLTRLFEWETTFGDRFGGVYPIDSAQPSFADYVELDLSAELRMQLEADAAGMAPLPVWRAGDTRFVRLKAIGPRIYTGGVNVNHELTIDLAVKVRDPGDFGDNDGVNVFEWTFDLVHDPAWTRACRITLINKLAAL